MSLRQIFGLWLAMRSNPPTMSAYRSIGEEDLPITNVAGVTDDDLLPSGNDIYGVDVNVVHMDDHDAPPHREVILITLAEFLGYAILVSFQAKLKKQMHIIDGDNPLSHQFSFAASFLYIGNLVFRLMHNVVFGFLSPRQRVYLSMTCMSLSMFFIGFIIFIQGSNNMIWVFLAYALGGLSIGSFESNLLSCITPLGHNTKVWAIIGFPTGFCCISVLGFMLTAVGVPPVAMYLAVMVLVMCGLMVFIFRIPEIQMKDHVDSFHSFISNMREWREWFPHIVWHATALTVDMFCVSLFSGVLLYIMNDSQIPIFGPNSTTLFPHDWFFAIHNSFTLVGDTISRKLMYTIEPRHPWVYLLICAVGAVLCLIKIPILAPLGIFLVFFTNGSIYATSTRHIDTHVPKQYNLIALSMWLFVGDIGSVIGSNTLSYIRDLVCATPSLHMCVKN